MKRVLPAPCKAIVRRKSRPLSYLLVLMIFPAPVQGQVTSRQIDAIFAGLNSSNAPGASVLVVHNGRVVFHRGYGVTDLRTLQKIEERTNFRLAS
ncbi:MAG: hypothetical protein QOF94_1804, partial [Acidobacteriaceae bacterium]